MKILTKEEEQEHYNETLKGGIGGGIAGLGLGTLGVYAIISADHFSRAYEKSKHPDEQFEDSAAKARAEQRARQSNYERFMTFGKENRYKIVGASWVASMAAALTIVGRSPYLSTTQKLVQARVYAQGLTLAVLVATAVFEIGDRNKDEGRWETVKYVDPNDPEHKKMLEKRVHHERYRGEDQWRDMVEAEEQRQEARMAAIHEQEEQDRRTGKLTHKKKEHHDNKKQKVKEDHGENEEKVEKEKKQKEPDQGKTVRG
ncbi:MAG: hypothetical protein LQ337_002920 [Flavoplaca oasis]|nr:MAG: hypothetical protein LQ337_002920 [Flavoplaca oasis]